MTEWLRYVTNRREEYDDDEDDDDAQPPFARVGTPPGTVCVRVCVSGKNEGKVGQALAADHSSTTLPQATQTRSNEIQTGRNNARRSGSTFAKWFALFGSRNSAVGFLRQVSYRGLPPVIILLARGGSS